MHKVERNEAPAGLIKKNLEFKDIYKNIDVGDEWTKFTKTKLKEETVEQLKKMYKGCCAYCEGKYESTSYPHIDHFKPKSLYPELTFEYNNMNISCEKCNKAKSNKFDFKLINPSEDNPDEHIRFKKLLATPLDERGKFTIELLKLNSEEKTEAKIENYIFISERIEMAFKYIRYAEKNKEDRSLNEFAKEFVEKTIKATEIMFYHGKEYCTTYRHNFEDDVSKLKEYINNN